MAQGGARSSEAGASRGSGRLIPLRIYHLALYHPDGHLGLGIEVAPGSVIAAANPREVQIELLVPLQTRQLPNALTMLLFIPDQELAPLIRGGRRELFEAQVQGPDDITQFVDYAAFAPVVPTEQSPLDAQSLATLIQGGSAFLTLLEEHPVIFAEGAMGWLVVKAIRKWGGAVVDVGEDAIRYHLPTLLRIPRHDRYK